MAEAVAAVEIPKRALFKPSEVCDLANVQPYVLRTWEAEFPSLGVAKAAGGPRVYRRADVEQVLRIKHLLLVEGLTLAGARRKLEEEIAPVAVDAAAIDEVNKLVGANARERLTSVKRVLQSLLDLLGNSPSAPRTMKAKGKRPSPTPVRKKSVAKRTGGARRKRA
jgi:DNA-binding transcriptional MerR regulator